MKKEKLKKSSFWSNFWGFFLALMVALIIRSFAFEPYNIPSGSMVPTLLVGDYLFISKYPYGYSRHSFPFSLPIIPNGRIFEQSPKRGDVAIFRMTPQILSSLPTSIDYIKRIIGLPGDKIQMKNGRLYINDKLVDRQFIKKEKTVIEGSEVEYNKYIETLPNGVTHEIYEINDMMQADDTPPIIVPQNHFFAMGDNRDNSYDSRFFGVIPLTHLEGRAEFIFYSNNGKGYFWEFWKWPEFIRINRLFSKIY